MNSSAPSNPTPEPVGARMVATGGRLLPLRSILLEGHCRSGLARIELRQVFVNPTSDTLHVTYELPLPANGAVAAYRFTVGEQTLVGRVQERAMAREAFERALLEGRTAALLEQERSSLFTQTLGDIPPGARVEVTVRVEHRLEWTHEGAQAGWEWRFPTVVGPRYVGEPGRVADAPRLRTVHTAEPVPVEVGLALTIGDHVSHGGPRSSSHRMSVERRDDEHVLTLSDPHTPLDRDIVVQWAVAQAEVGVGLELSRLPAPHPRSGQAFGLLTLTPPTDRPSIFSLPRDLIIVMDASGSMAGRPLEQAKRIIGALVDTMSDRDQLELVAFRSEPQRWRPQAVPATADHRRQAQRWLDALEAGGGTEMTEGILEALTTVRPDAQRQVVLVTDGYIGFESEVIRAILERSPPSLRLHTLGVGSSVNRSLTEHAARAGRGVEILIGLDDDPERAVTRLRACTEAPVVVDLLVGGDAIEERASARPRDLLAGAPVMLPLRLRPEGGTVEVIGQTRRGRWVWSASVPPIPPGHGAAAIPLVFAADAVATLETRRATARLAAEVEVLDRTIERLGLDFQLSTRRTSWVAVSEVALVDPSAPSRAVVVPHAIPHGCSIEGLGLRPTVPDVPVRLRGPATSGDAGAMERDDTVVTVLHRVKDVTGLPADACVVVIYGAELGRKYNIQGDEVTIGRATANDICVAQDSVSRMHATLSVDSTGGVSVYDHGSTNGTYVNDQRVDAARLQDGDLLKVGRSIFKFLTGQNIESAYHEEIYRLSTIDGLTEVFNKRHFADRLAQETSRARRYRRPLALIMFDLDHFKRCNDTFGHRAGDHVLRRVAKVVKERSRSVDVVARYGGEEFAIILPEIGLDGARYFGETIRQMIEQTQFSFEGHQIPLTISVGVAELGPEMKAADALVQAADAHLYRAKREGRNRVVAAHG